MFGKLELGLKLPGIFPLIPSAIHVVASQLAKTDPGNRDTKGLPTESKVEGKIVLGHIQDGSTNEHLNNDQPLASGFPLSAGSTKVYVPDVPPRDDYIVNLFGDSGNISERFTISL